MLNAAFNEIRPRRKVETLASMGCYGATNRDASEYHGNYVDEENYFKVTNTPFLHLKKLYRK